MANLTWVHISAHHDPDATAPWFEKMLGAEITRSMQQGAPRIDMKIGGANVFLAPVKAGDGVNAPPVTPYQGLDHFGLSVSGIDAIAADLKAKGVEFTREPTTVRLAPASASSAGRKAYRSNCSTARSEGKGYNMSLRAHILGSRSRSKPMDTKWTPRPIRSPTPMPSGGSC